MEHRLVWLYVHGAWPKRQIDHINGNRSDNRIENLREASALQNSHNKKRYKNNTTGFTGVSYRKRDRRYEVYFKDAGESKFLGSFRSAEHGFYAYKKAVAYRGRFLAGHMKAILIDDSRNFDKSASEDVQNAWFVDFNDLIDRVAA